MPSASFVPDLSVPPLLQNFAGSHIEGDHSSANGDNIEDSASLCLPITGIGQARIRLNSLCHAAPPQGDERSRSIGQAPRDREGLPILRAVREKMLNRSLL